MLFGRYQSGNLLTTSYYRRGNCPITVHTIGSEVGSFFIAKSNVSLVTHIVYHSQSARWQLLLL